MNLSSENLLALRSTKAQLEVGLIYLRRRHGELARQLEVVQSQERRGSLHPDALLQLRRTVQDHSVEIERRSREIQQLDDRIQAIQRLTERSAPQSLAAENDAVTAEISEVREQILAALRQLAEPLRRYEALAERKNRLATDLAARTGRNQAYQNYIDSSLLRQAEFVDDVRYSVETLRRQRVVA
jgi:hypothetical protein